MRAALITLLVLCLPLAAPTSAQVQVPPNEGWVTDLGNFLTDREEAELERLMQSYLEGSGYSVALLTLQDLGGRSIEETALEVGRQWKIGSQADSGAALLLVSRAERKSRIEVGRYLEGNLTDAISRRILDNVLRPAFQAGKFGEGLTASVVAIHAAAGGDYAPIEQAQQRHRRRGGGSALSSLLTLGFVMFILFAGRNSRGGGMGGMWPLLFLMGGSHRHHGGHRGGGFGGGGFGGGGGGGFGGFGGGGSFGGGGASGGW